ncbi:MAG: FecR domain-containing protein, partial [Gallionella sp.]
MMRLSKMSCCLMVCFASHAAYAVDAPAEKDFSYQVQKGDNLSRLTAEVLDTPSRWNAVAKYNKLPNANLIYPAQVLHIPFAWLKNDAAQARIEALSGEVKLNGQPAHVGDVVKQGDQLETASAASLRMTLPDGSTLNMLEKTQLEAKDLQQKKRGNIFSAIFRLTTGRIDALKKKYPDGQSPLRIQALHGTIGVRGTHFRVGQEGENTLAEIEQGLVGFESDATKPALALAGGQGTLADGVHPAEVITLLPAPTYPTLPDQFPANAVKFVMPEMAGATAYRGEVAKDEAYTQIVAPVSAKGAEVNISGLAEGSYWLRLRAIDEHGLQGLEA